MPSIDPTLIKAARQVYRAYYEVEPKLVKRPTGVVVDRLTYRGKPVFSHKPILLPSEEFISIAEIEGEQY